MIAALMSTTGVIVIAVAGAPRGRRHEGVVLALTLMLAITIAAIPIAWIGQSV